MCTLTTLKSVKGGTDASPHMKHFFRLQFFTSTFYRNFCQILGIWELIITFCEPCPATSGLTKDCGATNAQNNSLCMTENSCDLVASGALDIHEVWVGMLHKPLQLVFPLLIFRPGMEQIFSELKKKWNKLMISLSYSFANSVTKISFHNNKCCYLHQESIRINKIVSRKIRRLVVNLLKYVVSSFDKCQT